MKDKPRRRRETGRSVQIHRPRIASPQHSTDHQVVDVFDALTTVRSYRQARHPEEAIDLLRKESRRGWWDGKIVEAWTTLWEGQLQGLPAWSREG